MSQISIIVPYYNAASYIERCLQGFERQTYRDFDVILIDDYSDDATQDVIRAHEKCSDLNLIYHRNEQNLGPAASRKKGVELSNSKYIAFCDSDDWYEANFLETMIKKAQINDADMVFCGHYSVFEGPGKNRVIAHVIQHNTSELDASTILELNVDSLCVILMKREVMDGIPVPNIRNGEDMALIPLMIANSTKFGIVTECLYNYVCRNGSASMQANDRVVESLEHSFEHIFVNMPEKYHKECEIIGIRNLIYGGLLSLFKYSFDKKRAMDILELFEERYPNWWKNVNIKKLPKYKQIFVKFAARRQFLCLKILSMIHWTLTRN